MGFLDRLVGRLVDGRPTTAGEEEAVDTVPRDENDPETAEASPELPLGDAEEVPAAQPSGTADDGSGTVEPEDTVTAAEEQPAASRASEATDAAPAAEAPAAEAPPAETPAAKRVRPGKPDSVLAEARDIAHAAIVEIADAGEVGAHEGVRAEGQRLVSHYFACTAPGYRGWSWVAVLARAPRSKKATVCETALLPGDDAIVSPTWVPWDTRLQPGDMRPQDVLPRLDEDPTLQPGLEETGVGQEDYEDVTDAERLARYELGLGRERVLSPEGRRRAADRWQSGERGPQGEFAVKAERNCGSCGYLLPIAGSMRQQFGICASEWSPHDGSVVSLDAGCGAHSETDVEPAHGTRPEPQVDDLSQELEPVQLS